MKNLSNIGYTFIGNLVVAFIKWMILIIIVRISTPSEVGNYTFAIAITTPIILFINMRLRLRYIVEDDLEFSVMKRIRSFLNIICIILIIGLGFLFYQEYVYYILIIGFSKILDLNSEIYYAILHKLEKYKYISMMMITKSILIIITFAISLYFSKSVIFSLILQVVIQFIFLNFVEKRSEIYVDKSNTKYLWKVYISIFLTGLPLGVVQLLNSYNILIPRYIIENKLSLESVGIFAAISYLLTIVDLFMNSVSQNIIITIKNKIKSGNFDELKTFLKFKVTFLSLIIGLIFTFFVYLFGEKILTIIYGEQYGEMSLILTLISISFMFNFQSWIFDTTIMAMKIYKAQLLSAILTLCFSTIISLYLISKYGLIGASLSVVFITFIQSTFKKIIVIYMINKLMRSQ